MTDTPEWTIQRCATETEHAQKPKSHFCRCTHVMYDSEKPGAAQMPAMHSMTLEERSERVMLQLRRYRAHHNILSALSPGEKTDCSCALCRQTDELLTRGWELP